MNTILSTTNYRICLFLLISIFAGSCKYVDPCYSKDSFMDHLEETIDNVKENGEDFTKADWEVMDQKVEKIMDECYEKYKEELSEKENEKILIYAATYVYERQKEKLTDFMGTIENLELDLKAKEFLDQADDQIKDIFNEVLKDYFEKVVDSALDEFEKLARELKEKWNENKKK